MRNIHSCLIQSFLSFFQRVTSLPVSQQQLFKYVASLGFQAGLWICIHFFRILIRFQSLMLETNTDPDPDPIRIQGFNDQKLEKNYS